MAAVLAIIALVLEIVAWATTRDTSLAFIALVLVTLAVIVGGALPALPAFRRP